MGKKFVEAVATDDRDIVQSACYGIGLIAQHAPEQFKEILPAAVEVLAKVIKESDSRSEEKAVATECAIGAVGKIALFHFGTGIAGEPVLREYLALLPLKAESEEAQNVHGLLLKQIAAKNPVLFAPTIAGAVRDALLRIHATAKAEPSLEIVKSEDVPTLEQCIAMYGK